MGTGCGGWYQTVEVYANFHPNRFILNYEIVRRLINYDTQGNDFAQEDMPTHSHCKGRLPRTIFAMPFSQFML